MNSLDVPSGEPRAKDLSYRLLDWYDREKRDLPWRSNPHPYAVWISEIMAQQTRITALLPYYRRFVKRFPDIRTLAEAPEDEVLKSWEGLGYYARARNLQKAAQCIMRDYGGVMPSTQKELLSLPGIGEYTAGAILSIAFGQPYPAVDGNVLRVFARVENCDLDIASPAAKPAARQFVANIMPKDRAGCFTQALMELGALVCLPNNPLCDQCPVRTLCRAHALNRQQVLPVKAAKQPQKETNITVGIVLSSAQGVLMRKRTERLLHSLWEFYLLEGKPEGEDVLGFLGDQGLVTRNMRFIGSAEHTFTHRIWLMRGLCCEIEGEPDVEGYRWVHTSEFSELALPTALRFYTDWLKAYWGLPE